MTVHPWIANAEKVLEGGSLSREEAVALAVETGSEELPDLLALAWRVRRKFSRGFHACSILNAKCGVCGENCRFCAQSARHGAAIETYPLLPPEKALQAAREIHVQGVRTFGMVTSGRGWQVPDREFRQILDTLDLIRRELPDMTLCVSLGILSEECVSLLARHHVNRYNMNLQTSPARYHDLIATTHTIEEKIATIKLMTRYGIRNCTGGIFGLGESWADRVEMALTIRELEVDCVTMNILLPIPGTPLENIPIMSPAEAAKIFALYRLLLPDRTLRFCAGRETVMKDFQGLMMLAGADGLMTGGYLTTRGRAIADDRKFMAALAEFDRTEV